MLSHDNVTFAARCIVDTYKEHLPERKGRFVSYLPLSHVAANVTDIYVMMLR